MTSVGVVEPAQAGQKPHEHIVVIVTSYATYGPPEEAAEQVRDAYAQYETPHFVYAATSLDDLPHPMQVPEIAQHFGG